MNAFVRAWGNNVNKKTIVEDMEEGAAKEDDNIAISLYIAKEGESLWDVAKMLSTDEKTLMQLNPDIKLPLRSGDKYFCTESSASRFYPYTERANGKNRSPFSVNRLCCFWARRIYNEIKVFEKR